METKLTADDQLPEPPTKLQSVLGMSTLIKGCSDKKVKQNLSSALLSHPPRMLFVANTWLNLFKQMIES